MASKINQDQWHPSLYRWIEDAAEQNPDKDALIGSADRFTYAEFKAAIDGAIVQLQHMGISHGVRVAWYGLNQPEVFILLFACAKMGAILVPLNWRLADAEIHEIIADCQPEVLIYDDHFAAKAAAITTCPVIEMAALKDCADEELPSEELPSEEQPSAGHWDDAILLVYTSGSTGRPKGVVLAQKALVANAVMSIEAHQMTADDRVLTVLPLFHVGGLNILPTPAFSIGATVILHESFDSGLAIAALAEAELMIVVPTVLQMMMAHPDWAQADLTCVRALSIGSTDVPVGLINDVHDRDIPVIQIYGATETSPFAIYQHIPEAFNTVGSIGRAGAACEIALKDENGNILGEDEVGEICVRGDNILTKYWQDQDLTTQMIRDGWFHTGDMARRDAAGLYWFTDRIKHIIISGGENIYPAEVERVLQTCPGVKEVAVVGKPDDRWGEVPVAVIAPEGGLDESQLTEEMVISFMQDKLARYKQPRAVIFVDALPRNAMNKVVAAAVKKKLT